MTMQTVYQTPGNQFGVKDRRFYGPGGHRGKDFKAAARSAVLAYEDGVVVRIESSSILGHTVTIRSNAGGVYPFMGWAHILPRVSVGQIIKARQLIGFVAGYNDTHGTAWSGPHIHTTRSDVVTGVFYGRVVDAGFYIQNALTLPVVTASGGRAFALNPPSTAVQLAIQVELKKRGRYKGILDGRWGPLSYKGIQLTIKNVGYRSALDGIILWSGCGYIQLYAQKFGSYGGKVDHILGPNSWAGFLLGLKRP